MIGRLPKTLNVNGVERAIRTDYRVALCIFQAFNDVNLKDLERTAILLDCLYVDKFEFTEDAITQAMWFLDGGKTYEKSNDKKVMDWEQDSSLIFSAVNRVAGKEVRELEYMHWWTFLGLFAEIGECLLSTVINIRSKKNRGKKLEKHEQEFYKRNKDMVDLKKKYTVSEQQEIERLNKLLG